VFANLQEQRLQMSKLNIVNGLPYQKKKPMKLIDKKSSRNEVIDSHASSVRAVAHSSGMTDLHALPLMSLIEIPFARKRSILVCLLGSVFLGWLTIIVWPRTYVSHAELLFQVGRESVALDPTVTTGQTMILQKSQEEDINSALQILQSRQVLEMVVESLGEDAILSGHLPSSGPEKAPSILSRIVGLARSVVDTGISASGLHDDISDHEMALMRLSGCIEYDAPKKSTVITVEATSKSPEMAQAIAQNVVDAFLKLHSQTMQTKGSRDFFIAQTESATKRLLEAQGKKRRFLEERKLVSIEAKQDMMKEQMSSIETDLLTTQRELEQALAKSKQLDTDIVKLQDITTAAEQENTGTNWGALRQRVYELELQELKETTKYTDGHKVLEATRKELVGARKILNDFKNTELRDKNTVPNPLKQKLQEELKLNDSLIAGLRSAIEQRRSQLSRLEGEVTELLRDANELSQVERDIDQYASSLRLLREKEEEARVIDELRMGGISSVNQFQPATLVERPIKPNKKLLMAAFVMLGLVSGLGLAYLREVNSGAVRTAFQAAQRLDVPVIGEVHYNSDFRGRRAFVDRTDSSGDMMQMCRSVLSEMLVYAEGRDPQEGGMTLGIISVDAGSGASTMSMALAVSSSEDFQLSTILVEADRAGRTISKEFGLNGSPGLAELALGEAEPDECLQPALRPTLRLVSSSSEHTANQPNVASCKDIASAIAQIQKSSDLVIVDLPPASSPDKLVGLAQHLDYVIVVLESGKTELKSASRLLRTLEESEVQLIGVVLNKSKNFLPQSISQVLNAHA
jgi:polysaccharide biosynthesis transport protein